MMEQPSGMYLLIMEIGLVNGCILYSLRLYIEQFGAVLKITESPSTKLMLCM